MSIIWWINIGLPNGFFMIVRSNMAKKNSKTHSKVTTYRKPMNLNVGVVIFAFIFIYMVASVVIYMGKEDVHIYEVVEGSLTESTYADYPALILRQESLTTAEASGYINYYIRDGRKVGKKDLVYTIDETGRMLELLDKNMGESSLPSEDLREFKAEVAQFSLAYDPMDFGEVYDMKASMQSTLLEYVNANALEELAGQLSSADSANFIKAYTTESGVISAVLDGLESLTPNQITAKHFDSSLYPKDLLVSGEVVEAGAPVYRTVLSEEWYILFPMTEKDVARFQGVDRVGLVIKGSSQELSGGFEIYVGADGGTYGKITLDRYMVQFVNKRYVNIQVQVKTLKGLKLPKSSVLYKSFFKVPVEYMNEDKELLVESYAQDGTVSTTKMSALMLAGDEEYCYLDASAFSAGQHVVREDSTDRFQLAVTVNIPGVYNVNKGYAVFRKISIQEENEEYIIISAAESSVSMYDHIVLNSTTVSEGDIIYY